MKKLVPFYANTEDDTHCYQSALKMVLGYFLPENDFSWETLDKITDKIENKWTWPQAGLLSLIQLGFEIVIIDAFDYKRFLDNGVKYLEDEYGKEVALAQQKNSDIENAMKHIKKLLEIDLHFEKNPSIEVLKKYIDKGYLLICNVNSSQLNNNPGYIGHFVVIYRITETHIEFHDPGLPPYESRRETIENFSKAWEISKDAYAFKLKK